MADASPAQVKAEPSERSALAWVVGPSERVLMQIPRALVASGIAAGVDVGLLAGTVEIGHVPYVLAAVIAYTVGGLVNYALCARWVFPHAPKSPAAGFAAFMALSLVGLAVTAGTVHLLANVAELHYMLAKTVALILAFAWNFSSRRWLIFRQPRLGGQEEGA